ncbi:dual specificity phosphatase, catalytic domain [Cymbomonas tetramitiformis]|uniref:Dual specificity phosphatase, catalytic domain n=1 Tax=Cymbomonas tetramitiformis TaxID=36881 RepID=A0AAE0GVZ8_9CHLO|nr:dual specificity phosphatase, catalytic domain [Cymbomonas tetramitiformis]
MLGVKYIVNTVPNCQNLYRNSFNYFNVTESGKTVPLEECLNFIASVEQESARVLVHCMSGKSRSTSVVVAFLMKSRGWTLAQSLEYVVQRRPTVDLTEEAKQQLQAFEQHVPGRAQAALPIPSMVPQPPATPVFGGGFPPCPTQPLFNFGGTERPPPPPNFTGQSSVFSLGTSGQGSERPQTFVFGARHEVSAQALDARTDGMDTGG